MRLPAHSRSLKMDENERMCLGLGIDTALSEAPGNGLNDFSEGKEMNTVPDKAKHFQLEAEKVKKCSIP